MNGEDFPPMEVHPPKKKAEIVVSADASPLDLLKAIYTNEVVPLPTRMRAAIEAAQYVHPRLSAAATFATGQDFADQLEQRRRSRIKSGEGSKLIEAPKGTNGHHKSPEEVSASAMGKSFAELRRRI